MPNNNKVLVVSEDPGLRRDLVTILEFLGEGPVAADDLSVAAQLQDGEGQPEGFSVAVLAGDGQALRDSLQELARIAPALPALLAGGPEAADLPSDLASRIIARLEWLLTYDLIDRIDGRALVCGLELICWMVGYSSRILHLRVLL